MLPSAVGPDYSVNWQDSTCRDGNGKHLRVMAVGKQTPGSDGNWEHLGLGGPAQPISVGAAGVLGCLFLSR